MTEEKKELEQTSEDTEEEEEAEEEAEVVALKEKLELEKTSSDENQKQEEAERRAEREPEQTGRKEEPGQEEVGGNTVSKPNVNLHLRLVEDVVTKGHDGDTVRNVKVESKVDGGSSFQFNMPIDDFFNDTKLEKRLRNEGGTGLKFTRRDLGFVRAQCLEGNNVCRLITKLSSIGWHDGMYITPSVFIKDGQVLRNENFKITLTDAGDAELIDLAIISDPGFRTTAKHVVNDLLAMEEPEVMFPLIGSAFLAPAITFLGIHHRPIIWIWGPSGTGKTTVAKLVQCFFGKFNAAMGGANWGSTSKAIELKGCHFKDALFVVDDFKIGNLGGSLKSAERLLQNYSDFTGRSRMKSGGRGTSSTLINSLMLVTGEGLPNRQASLMARTYVIPMMQPLEPDKRNKRKRYSKLADMYPGVMARYIAWLQLLDWEQNKDDLEQVRDGYNELAGIAPNSVRIAENHSLVHFGFYLFTRFMLEATVITPVEMQKLNEALFDIQAKHMANEISEASDANPVEEFVSTLSELVVTGQNKIDDFHGQGSGRSIGFMREGLICLYPETTVRMVNGALSRMGKIKFSKTAIGRQLRMAGVLHPGDPGRLSKQIRCNGRQVRVWLMEPQVLGLLPEDEEPGSDQD